jgi:hypothetical protein
MELHALLMTQLALEFPDRLGWAAAALEALLSMGWSFVVIGAYSMFSPSQTHLGGKSDLRQTLVSG